MSLDDRTYMEIVRKVNEKNQAVLESKKEKVEEATSTSTINKISKAHEKLSDMDSLIGPLVIDDNIASADKKKIIKFRSQIKDIARELSRIRSKI